MPDPEFWVHRGPAGSLLVLCAAVHAGFSCMPRITLYSGLAWLPCWYTACGAPILSRCASDQCVPPPLATALPVCSAGCHVCVVVCFCASCRACCVTQILCLQTRILCFRIGRECLLKRLCCPAVLPLGVRVAVRCACSRSSCRVSLCRIRARVFELFPALSFAGNDVEV